MKLAGAKRAAGKLWELLEPVCEAGHCCIAGSVRRECPEPGDLELVIIPKWGTARGDGDLFADHRNLAQLAIEGVGETLVPIKPGTRPEIHVFWHLNPSAKYWRLWLPKIQATADIFICSPETWGLNFAIRTGSADFSHGLARRWNQLGGVFSEARLVDRTGEFLDTPTERDVFHHLGIQWVDPRDRTGADRIREQV